MTKEEVKKVVLHAIEKHNKNIDDYMLNVLPVQLGYEKGKTDGYTIQDWFKSYKLIEEQDFYLIGDTILKWARKSGFDVKMNMQNNKLVYCGELTNE